MASFHPRPTIVHRAETFGRCSSRNSRTSGSTTDGASNLATAVRIADCECGARFKITSITTLIASDLVISRQFVLIFRRRQPRHFGAKMDRYFFTSDKVGGAVMRRSNEVVPGGNRPHIPHQRSLACRKKPLAATDKIRLAKSDRRSPATTSVIHHSRQLRRGDHLNSHRRFLRAGCQPHFPRTTPQVLRLQSGALHEQFFCQRSVLGCVHDEILSKMW